MTTKLGFTMMSIVEFEQWIKNIQVARTILFLQEHHTFLPDYNTAKNKDHFDVQQGMKNYHIHNNKWADIAQHFTIFPDGMIMTGRSLEMTPACIKGRNANAICIENLGNFDPGGDTMSAAQRESILRASAAIARRFSIPINSDFIVYHHWFDLNTGARTNGNWGSVKSCPGATFFGGNKVKHAEEQFLPLVKDAYQGILGNSLAGVLRFGYVASSSLNIRNGPGTQFQKLSAATQGTILRIYKIQDGWYKIARFRDEWVFGTYVNTAILKTVNVDRLNIRTGPGVQFQAIGSYQLGDTVFVFEDTGIWSRMGVGNRWVASKYLTTVPLVSA